MRYKTDNSTQHTYIIEKNALDKDYCGKLLENYEAAKVIIFTVMYQWLWSLQSVIDLSYTVDV